MNTDAARTSDSVRWEVNPRGDAYLDEQGVPRSAEGDELDPEGDADEIARLRTPQASSVAGRPPARASRADLVEYVVALGADRAVVDASTRHFVQTSPEGEPVEGSYVDMPALTVAQLWELAERLGG